MKILKTVILAVAFALGGCSSDSEQSTVLLRKIVQTTGGEEHIATYHYDGNRLDYIDIGQDEIIDYTYSGNLISEISYESYEGDVVQQTLFYYQEGLLVKSVTTQPWQDFVYEAEYFYNPDNTVDYTVMATDWDGSFSPGNPGKYFFDQEGSLIKVEQYGPAGTTVIQYDYDQNLNPYYNIAGYDRLMDFNSGMHNILNIDGPNPRTFEYTYNSAGYPISATVSSSGSQQTTQYIY